MSLSSSLNHTASSLKQSALQARSFRVQLNPLNGATFGSGEVVKWQMPTVARQFADLGSCVVKGKVKVLGTANDVSCFDTNIYSVINRLEIGNGAGQQIDNITQFNVLAHALSDIGSSCLLSGQSTDLLLNAGDPANKSMGQPISTQAEADGTVNGIRSFLFPLASIGLCATDKLINLDSIGLTFDFHLEDYRSVFVQGNAAATGYELSDLIMEFNVCELTPNAYAAYLSTIGKSPAMWDYEGVDCTQFSKPAATLILNQNIGARYSSLNRMLVIQRATANINASTQLSLSNRSTANLSELEVRIGGVSVPQTKIKNATEDQNDVLSHLYLFEGGFGSKELVGKLNQPMFLDYNAADRVVKLADGDQAVAALSTTTRAIQDALHKSLVGSIATSNATSAARSAGLKLATVGNRTSTANTIIRPQPSANNSHYGRVSQFGIENGTQTGDYAVGAVGLTRATAQNMVGTFMVGLNFEVFRQNDAMFNNVSTIGSNVDIVMKYSAAATSAQTINVYSFYHKIIQLNPLTRTYELVAI